MIAVAEAPPKMDERRDDARLIAATLQGDDNAFTRLVNAYLPLVYSHLYRMTGSRDLAEDVSQETFIRVYKNLARFDRKRPFRPWLLRIATNAAISALRKNSKAVSLDAMRESGAFDDAARSNEADEPPAIVERQLSEAEVMTALASLDPRYRAVLLLRYKEDLSYEEVAQVMKTPLNTVRTWIRRARGQLAKSLCDQTGKTTTRSQHDEQP